MNKQEKSYLELLSCTFPTIEAASTEIINLQSILNLPKGTEHFMSDIHGEFEAFSHVLKNGSGAVRKKIEDVFGHSLTTADKSALATLIYYPKEKMELVQKKEKDMDNWYKITLYRLIEVCKTVSSKYTRSKVRKALPPDYSYVIEELIAEKPEVLNKEAYYEAIVNTIVELGNAENFIVALAELIQRLVIDRLHVIGDIYDRGSGSHLIMDRLCKYHSLDIQWGNHDVLWMGAAIGNKACIASAIRNSIRYGNLDMLEEGYGINMLPLATFAMDVYKKDPCTRFVLKGEVVATEVETELVKKMHKAIAIIKFKLDGQLAKKYPEFGMTERSMMDQIDYEHGWVTIDGKKYQMRDMHFPTVDPNDPTKLSPEEEDVMNHLQSSFIHCEKLQKHMNLLMKKGNMYKTFNGNLLYHGCMPMNEDGTFAKVWVFGKEYKGKELYDVIESYVRKAVFSVDSVEKKQAEDIFWFLWTGPRSPLYGRDKMATFERYFLDDPEVKKEYKNEYYQRLDKAELAATILKEFGLSPKNGHIINGHVPVHRVDGEKPVKCEGKLIIIDGGFSKTYRKETGIAGYTLIYNSYGLTLAAHDPFVSREEAVSNEIDIASRQEAVQYTDHRILVGDTDNGKQMKCRIKELKALIEAYRLGEIKEKTK
ncbi:fructose-1,6-bisphosphatase [Lachnobacterium bovis]|uniref:Fructose-1,6-bisphosphatase class 3 n=1 Tax=Lachnobacterium bovis DSM 14045 TaxID=1122142 RepID=A0A1H3HK09_9FIRM|nr:fructose-1,6-bisphosphatase [Lachnobacterium bovis]SDY15886.1 fructose-1,6-bisphosphatase-3 [Lachnobacterium bovis DSM 14045]